MKRIVLLLSISVLAVVILASVQLVEAQAPAKVSRVGFLGLSKGLSQLLLQFCTGCWLICIKDTK